MAIKKRAGNGKTDIKFDTVELLRIHTLLHNLEGLDEGYPTHLNPESRKWLENAIELFTPEFPDGPYSI